MRPAHRADIDLPPGGCTAPSEDPAATIPTGARNPHRAGLQRPLRSPNRCPQRGNAAARRAGAPRRRRSSGHPEARESRYRCVTHPRPVSARTTRSRLCRRLFTSLPRSLELIGYSRAGIEYEPHRLRPCSDYQCATKLQAQGAVPITMVASCDPGIVPQMRGSRYRPDPPHSDAFPSRTGRRWCRAHRGRIGAGPSSSSPRAPQASPPSVPRLGQ